MRTSVFRMLHSRTSSMSIATFLPCIYSQVAASYFCTSSWTCLMMPLTSSGLIVSTDGPFFRLDLVGDSDPFDWRPNVDIRFVPVFSRSRLNLVYLVVVASVCGYESVPCLLRPVDTWCSISSSYCYFMKCCFYNFLKIVSLMRAQNLMAGKVWS